MRFSEFIHAVALEEGKKLGKNKPATKTELGKLWGLQQSTVSRYGSLDTQVPTWIYVFSQERYGWDNERTMELIQADYPDWRIKEITGDLAA